MRRLHIPFMLLLALYLVEHFGPRLREGVSNFTRVTQAQARATGIQYAPAENLERLDLAALRSTQRTLDICMYAWTDRYLAEAVAELANHGVTVRIYRDGSQYEEEEQHGRGRSAMDLLRGVRNVQIRVKPPSARALMHLKAYNSDRALLREGSANWSPAGLKEQDNSLIFLSDRQSIENFAHDFEVLWDRPGNIKVQ
jgi:phosphatidylserine/phosphatidylglycerophosphate/cardiolipin synthase-like enzyme